MAESPTPGRRGGRRRRGPPRLVTVENVSRPTPRLTRITLGGDALEGFGPPRPGAHMKLFFVPPGTTWSPSDDQAARPPSRTYTPLRHDPANHRLDVEFVHHGDGLAAGWAAAAEIGETLYIAGPGGGYDIAPDATDIVVVADDTAMPAAGTVLDALPGGCRATAIFEVADVAEERDVSPKSGVTPIWLHRGDSNGETLDATVRRLSAPLGTADWWIACEAATMRRIRRHLLEDRGLDPARVHTRGYWRLGETNYPDHDYGND